MNLASNSHCKTYRKTYFKTYSAASQGTKSQTGRFSWLAALILALMVIVPANVLAADSGVLSGRWSGGWSSQTTGHKGPMQATFQTSGTGSVQATFRGRFFKVIPFVYRTELNVVAAGEDYVEMAGSKRLGPLMGSYSYHAVATGGTFEASYRTKRDQGTFSLRRSGNR